MLYTEMLVIMLTTVDDNKREDIYPWWEKQDFSRLEVEAALS